MEELDEQERHAVLLRYFAAKTHEEIAEVLGRSATSVRRLLGRALKSLGQRLEHAKRETHGADGQ